MNYAISGNSKVFRRRVIGVNHSLDSFGQQRFRPACVLHEVEHERVVKVGVDLGLVLKAEAIVKFCKFKNHFDCFGLVCSRQTPVLFSAEDSFATLENEMRTNGVLFAVLAHIPIVLLFWQKDNRAEIAFKALLTLFGVVGQNGVPNVAPNVWRVVSVQIYDGLFESDSFGGWFAFSRNLVEVVLVSMRANCVDCFVKGHVRVLLLVGICEVAEDAVITYLLEGEAG